MRLAGRWVRAEFSCGPAPPLPPRAAVIRKQSFPRAKIESVYWQLGPARYRFWWSDAGAFDLDARRGRVQCYLSPRPASASVEEVLRGPVASFFLLHQGFEPLHAGAVALRGRCAIFLGAPGAGKSSLVAFLSKHGARFISDDILPVRPRGNSVRAYAGLPHIRLAPRSLRALAWQHRAEWRSKWKSSVRAAARHPAGPFRISRLYVLDRQQRVRGVEIISLLPGEGFVALVSHSRNDSLDTPWRLRAQLRILGALADSVPVRRLTYASGFRHLPEVRRQILRDMQS
jgi:hypothetical protein